MGDKSKIFMSYSRVDERIAAALARDFESVGVEVWRDVEAISVGERWSTAIQRALEESYAMILILSPESMASQNVEDEFTYFLDNKKPIVPIMVRETRLHFQLNRLQWIDFMQPNTEKAYRELLEALMRVGVVFEEREADSTSIISQLMDEIIGERQRSQRRRLNMAGIAVLLTIIILVGISFLLLDVGGSTDDPPIISSTREFVAGRIAETGTVLYEAPSRDSSVILAELPIGLPLFVRQRTPDERFLLVDFGLNRGFVLRQNISISETEIAQIGVYISPTPPPTATPTPFLTPTATPTPSPTPEQVLDPVANECIITVADNASAQPVFLGPSAVLFAALDSLKPTESIRASARNSESESWLYIGIGWIDSNPAAVQVSNLEACEALPLVENLLPNRIRPFIKDLPFANSDTLARNPIIPPPEASAEALAVVQAWNNYGGLLENLAQLLSVDAPLLAAVIVEDVQNSNTINGNGEDMLILRFEADIFWELLPKEQEAEFDSFFYVDPSDPNRHMFRRQKEDAFMDYQGVAALTWEAFNIARTLNPEMALRALRYGENGLLGDWHAQIGYTTPQDMYDAFISSQSARVVGRLDYIKNNPSLLEALRAQDWLGVGQNYDGGRVGALFAAQSQAHHAAFVGLE